MQVAKDKNHPVISGRHQSRGFTLAEMALVVVIGSILLVTGVKVLTAQMDSASYSATRTKQDAIKQALINYLARFQRLPCPDTRQGQGPGVLTFTTDAPPDGLENRSLDANVTTNCAGYYGVLPYATLGLSRDMALDGWGNLFSYQLSTNPDDWELAASFSVTNQGDITVNDRNPAGAVAQLNDRIVVTIVSHGKNGLGAYNIKGTRSLQPGAATNPDELENTDADTTYFKREYTDDVAANGGPFDDLVLFLTTDDLVAPLQRDGTFQTPGATVIERLRDIENALVGTMMGGCETPVSLGSLGLPASTIRDPWGSDIDYMRLVVTLVGELAPDQAVQLRSFGPNQVDDGGLTDDITVSMTVGQLRGLVGPYNGGCL